VRKLSGLTREERERRYGFLERLAPAAGAGTAAAAAAGSGKGSSVEASSGKNERENGGGGGTDGGRERGECTPTLTLYEADLTLPHSFDKAIKGCTYVFHVASPVVYDAKADPLKDLLQPALAGVKNVFSAIVKAKKEEEGGREGGREGGKTFKRLILTSSTGAVYGGPAAVPKSAAAAAKEKEGGREGKEGREEALFTEEDWNEECSLSVFPYYYSKVMAEREGWREAGREGVDLVVVCPSYVWGPPAVKGAGSFNSGKEGREGGRKGGRERHILWIILVFPPLNNTTLPCFPSLPPSLPSFKPGFVPF